MVWELVLKLKNREIEQTEYERELIKLIPLQDNNGLILNSFNKKNEVKKLKKEYIKHLYFQIKGKLFNPDAHR